MGELIPFPSERNRTIIRAALNEAAAILMDIEELQARREEVLRSIGMGTIKKYDYETREDLW